MNTTATPEPQDDAAPLDQVVTADEIGEIDDIDELLVEEISIDGMCGVY